MCVCARDEERERECICSMCENFETKNNGAGQNVLFRWQMTFAYANALSGARRSLYDGSGDVHSRCVNAVQCWHSSCTWNVTETEGERGRKKVAPALASASTS